MTEKLLSSKEIIDRAISQYKPYAMVLMLSGGDDSLTALAVARYLQIPITHIMHGITGTGIKQTTEFVRVHCAKENAIYLEADAGDAYAKYVLRKGFFGRGETAHKYSYHILKWTHFRRAVSQNIRQRKRNRNILFINGARRLESKNREITMVNPIKAAGSNIWVNIINEWEKHECLSFLDYLGVKRNPVSVALCRSGECMCGTMQNKEDRIEASLLYPDWGKWVDQVEAAVLAKGFNWGWGDNIPSAKLRTTPPLSITQEAGFQPMCTGCKINFKKTSL